MWLVQFSWLQDYSKSHGQIWTFDQRWVSAMVSGSEGFSSIARHFETYLLNYEPKNMWVRRRWECTFVWNSMWVVGAAQPWRRSRVETALWHVLITSDAEVVFSFKFVCGLCKNYWTDFREISWRGGAWPKGGPVAFWGRSGRLRLGQGVMGRQP